MKELHALAGTPETKSNENGNAAVASESEKQKVNSINPIDSTWDDPVIPSRLATPNIAADLLPGWLGE